MRERCSAAGCSKAARYVIVDHDGKRGLGRFCKADAERRLAKVLKAERVARGFPIVGEWPAPFRSRLVEQ